MSYFDMSPLELLLNFMVTWALGLAPAIIARYAWYKQPLPRNKANWIAGISSVLFWILFLLLNAAAGERPGNGVVWIIMFFVSRWVMIRGHPDSDPHGRASSQKRGEMVERLQAIAANPDLPQSERQGAIARLKALGHHT